MSVAVLRTFGCVTPKPLRQLEYTKGLASFETELLDAPAELIANSLTTIEFMLRVVPSAEPEAWLQKQQLIREARPTVGGVLLFADEPQALLPKRSGIKLYRFQTSDEQGSRETLAFDPVTIEGSAYQQIRSAVDQTSSTVEQVKKLGEEGLEEISYPGEAIHEIITNAVTGRAGSYQPCGYTVVASF